MRKGLKIARWVWIIGITFVVGYDIYAQWFNDIPGDTLSEYVWDGRMPAIFVFAAGVVCGHLFWQRRQR